MIVGVGCGQCHCGILRDVGGGGRIKWSKIDYEYNFVSNIEFWVTCDKSCSRHPLSMVLIGFDTDLIDYPPQNLIQNWEFS